MDSLSNDQDDLVAYVFQPDAEDDIFPGDRPLKERRTKKSLDPTTSPSKPPPPPPTTLFVPLLSGIESPAHTTLRETLFRHHWSRIDSRITQVLRDANEKTLGNVHKFVERADDEKGDRVPAAFVITGPNIASQDLLFKQLEERLTGEVEGVCVRLSSAEVTTVKAALKQVVRAVTAGGAGARSKGETWTPLAVAEDGEEADMTAEVSGGDVDKYLDYDLAALQAWLDERREQGKEVRHVIVAFQDGEGFDSGLLSDLITLFASWSSIPFTLLFGIATSTEMLQARLLKSTCRLLFGAQFDVLQSMTILERVFRAVVAAPDVPVTLGPTLLRSFVDRQQDQVAGIQAFINGLKYTYMCHFYANPLSVLLAEEEEQGELPGELLEGVKSMASFQAHVEALVSAGELATAKGLLVDRGMLVREVRRWIKGRSRWAAQLLVATEVVCVVEKRSGTAAYIDVYAELLAEGIVLGPESPTMRLLRPLAPPAVKDVIKHFLKAAKGPLRGLVSKNAIEELQKLKDQLKMTVKEAVDSGHRVRSIYSSPVKAARTTVVAQKVALSRDETALTDYDHSFTEIIDKLQSILDGMVRDADWVDPETLEVQEAEREAVEGIPKGASEYSVQPASRQILHEAWLYDARTPHRDVFVPRPRMVFERGLRRPQDYLACTCCSGSNGQNGTGDQGEEEDGAEKTKTKKKKKKKGVPPATCVLYRLYLEAGSLVNVADLWRAFRGAAGEVEEREALALFYRGLAELRMLGFLKASRKKADHIAKVKWM